MVIFVAAKVLLSVGGYLCLEHQASGMEERLNSLSLVQELGCLIECNICYLYFPFEDFQREHDVPYKRCIPCRESYSRWKIDRRKAAREKSVGTVLTESRTENLSITNQDVNIPQKCVIKLSPLPNNVCLVCRYSKLSRGRKVCLSCIRSKCEKITQTELELKIEAIPFDGPNMNQVKHINARKVERYECKYITDYIFDETITRLWRNGLLVEEINRNATDTYMGSPIAGSITFENLQTI